MIKVKTFKYEEDEKANKFIEQHPPRSTDKQSGMVLNTGAIIIIYDDGKENPNDRLAKIATLLEGEREKKFLVEHKIRVAEIALSKIAPKDYEFGMDNTRIEKLLMAQGLREAKVLKEILGQIVDLENTIKMDRHELNRMNMEIEAYEDMLKMPKKK